MTAASDVERRLTRLGLLLFGLASALAVVAVLLAAWLAAHHRSQVYQGGQVEGFADVYNLGAKEQGVLYRRWARCAALLAVVSWPLVTTLWLYVWWKEDRERVWRLLPGIAAGLVPLTALWLLAAAVAERYGGWIHFGYHADELSLDELRRSQYRDLSDAFGLSAGAWRVAGGASCFVALVGVVALNLLPRAPRFSRGQLWLSGATLALGAAAFTASRAHAYDAAHPLPLWLPALETHRYDVPSTTQCGSASSSLTGITIVIDAHGNLYEGESKLDDLVALEKMLTERFALWRKLHPGEKAHGSVVFFAPPTLPVSTIAPALAAAQRAGAKELLMARGAPLRRWPTRTLGLIPFQRRTCATPIDAAQLPTSGTWGEWAQTLPGRGARVPG